MTKRRTRGDGSLYQRADGMWVGRVELPRGTDGKRRTRSVNSRDRNETIRKLKKLRADVDAGRIAVTGSTTVEKWLTRWLEIRFNSGKIRPSTIRSYEQVIRLYINPNVGDRRLDKLRPEHVLAMHDAIESGRYAQLAHVVLQRALDDAAKFGMVSQNVAKLVDKPSHTPTEREPLTFEQARDLLRSAIDTHDPWATRWAAALFLGARQGEILGLQWDRVNLTTGKVDLSWQLQHISKAHGCGERHSDGTWPCGRERVGYCPQAHWDLPRAFEYRVLHRSLLLTRPKTKKGKRIVPIPAPLWAMLEQVDRGDTNPHDLVWHHDDGRPINPRDDYDKWQAALKGAGLAPAPLHIARHTTATLLMIAGVPEEIRMTILGHAGIDVTRAYSHDVNEELARAAMDRALKDLLAPPAIEP